MRADSGSCRLRTVLSVLVTVAQLTSLRAQSSHADHGGVPMGHIDVCDDAKTHIAIDWDPSSTEEYTCDGGMISQVHEMSQMSCEAKTKSPIHVCYPDQIHYNNIPPTSGRHRPNWADYGEYTYVPPQRWLHDLEHGAIVMLYHPCANPLEVDTLRKIVTGCIRKHIITPYKLLPREMPFALLSWGCKLMMSRVVPSTAKQFIKDHGKKDGPEGSYAMGGEYNQSLIFPAQIVTDYDDSVVCPDASSQQVTKQGVPYARKTEVDALGYRSNAPDNAPSSAVQRYPILLQSLRRRQLLDRATERLQQSDQRLQQAFKQLMNP